MLLLAVAAGVATAHNEIDKAVANIEDAPGNEYVAYSERRNPTSKKVYKSSKVIIIPGRNHAYCDMLVKAFKKDSKKAVSFEVTSGGNVYVIKFIDGKERRSYIYVRDDGHGNALLTVEYQNASNAPSSNGRRGSADNEFDDDWEWNIFIDDVIYKSLDVCDDTSGDFVSPIVITIPAPEDF